MDLFFWRKKQKSVSDYREESRHFSGERIKRFIVKAVGLIAKQGQSRGDFSYPEYDFEEIREACRSDSYLKMAMMKYSYLIYKAGYKLKGEREEAVKYIKTRFRIMNFSTGIPMDILFDQIADDMVKYSNAFLIKARDDLMFPGIRATGFFHDKPVAGYFRIDPATMSIKRNKNGRVQQYVQTVDGEEKKFAIYDVVHFYMDKEPNDAFGTPRVIAALEDVKLLRKIEGNIISLIYRFAIPLYQWIIGLPEKGLEATDPEIKDAKKEIENMNMDGVLVTNERTQIKAIGAEGHALDATGYLNYFEKRVFSALGVSESQMGRGGAKQDADSMEAQIHDTVKHIQKIISIFIENYVIAELLLEGGFNPVLNEEDVVNYQFEEISLQTKIKLDNHELYKFQSNVATFEEVRRNMGKKPDADEDRLYANMIENKVAMEQIEAKAELSGGQGTKGNGTPVSAKKSGGVKSESVPENQYGKTAPKIKESFDIELVDKNIKNIAVHKKTYEEIYKKYEELCNDIIKRKKDSDILFALARDFIVGQINFKVRLAAQDGALAALTQVKKATTEKVDIFPVEKKVYKGINKILSDIQSEIRKRGKDEISIKTIFEVREFRIRFLIESAISKAYWYGFAKTCFSLGILTLEIVKGDSEKDQDAKDAIDTGGFVIDEIPPYHSYCSAELKIPLEKIVA